MQKPSDSDCKGGFFIKARTNSEYMPGNGADVFSAPVISCGLKGAASGLRIECYGSVESTNLEARERAAAGEPEGLVIAAESQTSGRGRGGKPFFSPDGSGLYFSILLRPDCRLSDCGLLTAAAAVAVTEAIEAVSGKEAKIKWVNDILIGGKKVCGILTEASTVGGGARLDYAVVGIGINVFEPEGGYPAEISETASSVFNGARGQGVIRAELAAFVLNNFFEYYKNLDKKVFLTAYKERSAVIGKEIRVIGASGSRAARAVDIDGDCRLVVRYGDGTEGVLSSGEISFRL